MQEQGRGGGEEGRAGKSGADSVTPRGALHVHPGSLFQLPLSPCTHIKEEITHRLYSREGTIVFHFLSIPAVEIIKPVIIYIM